MPKIVIATRGSQLALAQARWTAAKLKQIRPGLEAELKIIKTKGDKILDVPLAKVGGKGLFVKEIEDALLRGQADLAVHSMKDVPSELPDGLILAGASPREDPRDVLITQEGLSLEELHPGAKVGTSSLRRQAQLLALRPDLQIASLRGNVDTRLRKLGEQGLDGIILAAAGLARLGIDHRGARPLEVEQMLPAVGQGILGFEARRDDGLALGLIQGLSQEQSRAMAAAERAFLARLEGGCQVPIAGHAVMDGGLLFIRGLVADLEGKRMIRAEARVRPDGAEAAGAAVADELLAKGGREILEELYREEPA